MDRKANTSNRRNGRDYPARPVRKNADEARDRQLHVWMDARDWEALEVLSDHYRESHSVVVRRLLRVAAARVVGNVSLVAALADTIQ